MSRGEVAKDTGISRATLRVLRASDEFLPDLAAGRYSARAVAWLAESHSTLVPEHGTDDVIWCV